MFAVYRYTPYWAATVALTLGTLAFVPLDVLRQRRPELNKKLVKWFSGIIRQHEVNSFAGTTYLLLGTWVAFLFFPRPIVELTLLFLAVGDPVASFFGIRFGKDKILGRKTLQGSLGALLVCGLLGAGYFYLDNLMVERLLLVSVASGFIAAVSELVPLGRLDDNLTFPVLCASQLYVLFYLFGGLT
jgi:diacylglycerol kinase (CTP)